MCIPLCNYKDSKNMKGHCFLFNCPFYWVGFCQLSSTLLESTSSRFHIDSQRAVFDTRRLRYPSHIIEEQNVVRKPREWRYVRKFQLPGLQFDFFSNLTYWIDQSIGSWSAGSNYEIQRLLVNSHQHRVSSR